MRRRWYILLVAVLLVALAGGVAGPTVAADHPCEPPQPEYGSQAGQIGAAPGGPAIVGACYEAVP